MLPGRCSSGTSWRRARSSRTASPARSPWRSPASHVLLLAVHALCADEARSACSSAICAGPTRAASETSRPSQYADVAAALDEMLESEETEAGRDCWREILPAPPPAGEAPLRARSWPDSASSRGVSRSRSPAGHAPVVLLAAWQALLARLSPEVGGDRASSWPAATTRGSRPPSAPLPAPCRCVPPSPPAEPSRSWRRGSTRSSRPGGLAGLLLRPAGGASSRGASAMPAGRNGRQDGSAGADLGLHRPLPAAAVGPREAGPSWPTTRPASARATPARSSQAGSRCWRAPRPHPDAPVGELELVGRRTAAACRSTGTPRRAPSIPCPSTAPLRAGAAHARGRRALDGRRGEPDLCRSSRERVAALAASPAPGRRGARTRVGALRRALGRDGRGRPRHPRSREAPTFPSIPGYPPARLALVLEASGAPVMLTRRHLLDRCRGPVAARVLDLDETGPGLESAPGPEIHGENAAYILFTSGSTGDPQGRGRAPPRADQPHALDAGGLSASAPGDRVLQKTPLGFDASVWELFAPLLAGAELVLAEPDAHRDPARLAARSGRERRDRPPGRPLPAALLLERGGLRGLLVAPPALLRRRGL